MNMDKHDKYEVVKQAWFEINEHLRNNKQDYIEYLKFSAKMYKQPYSDAVLVFQQDRNATKIAEYKKWGRLGRYVRRGSHGVAVFGKNHTCRYLYDVTQTGGKELPEMWTLTDRNTPELLNTLNNRYNINAGSVKECIEAMTANSINSAPIAESVQNAISQMGLDTKQAEVYRHSLNSVVRFVVSQRCNLYGKIDLNTDVDVSALDLIKNARDMILFSRAVQHAAKDTLFEIEKEVIAIDRKNEALDNAKTAKQESTSDRVDDILQDLIKLKFSQEQILALKQAVVAAAQNGEHNIQHWVSIRYSPDELQHISSLVADYYAQSVIEQTIDSKGILNDYYTYVNELNGRLKLSDMFSHHDYSDEQKAMLQQGFSEGISITVLNEVDERLTVDEIKTFFEMFHQAVDGQIDPHDVQIYLDKAVIEHSKQNVQAVEVQDNSADTISADVTQQDKKIEPSRIIGLAENQLRPAVPNSSTSSITDSSGVVKSEKTFAEQINDVLNGVFPKYSNLKVCDTPQILVDIGCDRLPMLYTQRHLKDALHEKSPNNAHWHGLTLEQICNIPHLLESPAIIMDSLSPNKSADKSIVICLNNVDNDNAPIIVSVKPNGQGIYEMENVSSNFITSIYGKENGFANYVERAAKSNNILFWDKEKSQALFSCQRLQLPEAINNLDSNIIIHQSRNIVKGKQQENSADISSNDVKSFTTLSEPTITCEWSESNYFEDGKTYSVAEFDTLMEQADSEMVAGAKAAIEKYGSAKAWYEADADDEFSQFMGYDKVKFTINMPDGQTITERQDAGDGYGGVIDFLKRYSIYNSIVPELEAAKAAHMANLVDEVPTPTNETQPEIDKLLGRLKLDCDYYLKTGAEKHLWAETVEKQIAKINELYEKMPENAYFTREQIDDYEKKMLAIKNGEVEKPIPYETPTIDNNVLSEEKKTIPPVSESTHISATSDEQISLFETPPVSETVTIPDKDVKTEKVEKPKKNVKASTYHFDPDNVVVGGAAARCDANIAAIETLLKIESEKRLATPEEQKIMARYSGWGGTAQAFVAENENVSSGIWGTRQARLRELLSADEYSAARSSTLTSFYTPPEVIDSVYLALERFQFEGGNVLEPSMGVGNFFAKMPDEMRADSKLYGVELDSISGRIAKQLYPEDNIQIKGFEKTTFKNNSFDVVIGNIPFGDYGIADKAYDKYHFKIHDYFAAKAVDKVKPGGIVAIVTSKFTMDKKNDKARKYLAERCDLLGAVRLPSGTFKDADSVTTDIIFLKKRTTMTSVIPDWVHVSETANGIPCNQYFVDNPDMVLGTMSWDERMRGKYGADSKVTTCYANSDTPLAQQLINAISKIDGVIDTVETELDNGTAEILPADPTVRNFTHTIVDGDLYFRENEVMVKVTETGKSLERMMGLHTLRQATMELINAQADGCTDEQLAELQKKLNSTYDNFRTKFGNITDSTNSRCFSNDDDYNTLAALEVVNVENKTVEKAAIFTKRTILPDIPVSKVDTALEALQVSMDRLGKVDILYMSQLTDTTPEKVIADLGDELFRDPAKVKDNDPYSGYTESSEYLSGNIRDKLRIARDHAEHIDSSYNKNVEALMKVVPKDLEASEISVRIGANWIDVADYNNFLNEYAHANTYYYPVTRTKLGEYKIEGKTSDRSVAATETFGTSRMNSYQIFENLLNQRDILVRDRREEGDKVWYEINTKETQLAKEKARLMKEAFRNWLWEDMGRREKYVAKYNYLFNSIRGREYDGSHQTFPGMNASITLRKHQSNAIMRAKLGGNTLFAHEVGAGKSFEMVATVMEKKRLGLINKACVVVPKHLTLQMASEWLRLYPNAKLLVAKPEDFTKANRKRFIARCVTGDYDAVIMSFTQFERIPMSDEYKEQFMQKELHDIMSAISEAGRKDKSSVKALERQKKNIEERLEKLLSSPKDSSLCFEKLGF
uniref:LPD25 domain-containing protein n=1 Tax=Ruminococcus bicirculans (ex Wegman et al. 2014) TaxID=1160721 RepID=UPI003A900315